MKLFFIKICIIFLFIFNQATLAISDEFQDLNKKLNDIAVVDNKMKHTFDAQATYELNKKIEMSSFPQIENLLMQYICSLNSLDGVVGNVVDVTSSFLNNYAQFLEIVADGNKHKEHAVFIAPCRKIMSDIIDKKALEYSSKSKNSYEIEFKEWVDSFPSDNDFKSKENRIKISENRIPRWERVITYSMPYCWKSVIEERSRYWQDWYEIKNKIENLLRFAQPSEKLSASDLYDLKNFIENADYLFEYLDKIVRHRIFDIPTAAYASYMYDVMNVADGLFTTDKNSIYKSGQIFSEVIEFIPNMVNQSYRNYVIKAIGRMKKLLGDKMYEDLKFNTSTNVDWFKRLPGVTRKPAW